MSTLLQLLRISFWMLPVQRVLTVLGVLVILVTLMLGEHPWFDHPGVTGIGTLMMLLLGATLLLGVPLLLGGAWLRMLAASRVIQVLPHARGRLLASTITIVLLGTLLWVAVYWLWFWRFAGLPSLQLNFNQYAFMFMLTFNFATQCAIGVFIASRGPVWLAVALLAWVAPHVVLPGLGLLGSFQVLAGQLGVVMMVAAWVAFSAWFLRVRRISTEGWRRGNMGAAAVVTAAPPPDLTREQAMTRWVLGSATPLTIGLLWALCVSLLVGIQLLIGHDSPPHAVSTMLFGTLSLNAVVVAAMAQSAVARSRALWLVGARLRGELFQWCERLLLRVAAAILLPFVVVGAALWWWLPERPALPLSYLLPAILAPGLVALWFGLLMVRRSAVVTTVVGLAIVAGWYYGLVQPLVNVSAEPRWWLLIAQLGLIAVLRFASAHLWRSRDWLRGRRTEPMAG